MIIENTDKTSRKALVELLGIGVSHFHKLKQAGVFKSVATGQYNLKECIKSWTQYHADGRTGSDMADEKRLLVIAQRKQIELKMKLDQRELVSLAEAQSSFNAALVLVASQLDGLAGRVAGEVAGLDDPAAVRDLIFTETRRIRDAAAAKLETWAAGHAGSKPARTTPTKNGG